MSGVGHACVHLLAAEATGKRDGVREHHKHRQRRIHGPPLRYFRIAWQQDTHFCVLGCPSAPTATARAGVMNMMVMMMVMYAYMYQGVWTPRRSIGRSAATRRARRSSDGHSGE